MKTFNQFLDDMETIEAPAGEKCAWCDEVLEADDIGYRIDAVGVEPPYVDYHADCFIRSIVGSVGHQNKTCGCYGGTEDDPPGMTIREAARAAVQLHKERNL